MTNSTPIVRVERLTKHFPILEGILFKKQVGAVRAVDEVSFEIAEGETLGLVGESGCGKSTTGRTILQLYEPTSGRVFYRGTDLQEARGEERRQAERNMQIIFQDPYASLNPRMTVGRIIREPFDIHGVGAKADRQEKVADLMRRVGLNPDYVKRYPHEMSGGQRQRVGIARALALQPDFIVCDESISALDVSVQAQVVNLLEELQKDFGLTYLFIAHDLSMVKHISDRVAVMYLGKLVELADKKELYSNPLHPYTQALLSAAPVPNPRLQKKSQRMVLEGDVPSASDPPPGCRFHTRCPLAEDICRTKVPEMREITPGHFAACHLIQE
jgi:oligopeptide transport system ATP-binding protein